MGVKEKTVELKSEENGNRFASDVGPLDNVYFTINEVAELMVYECLSGM